MIPLKRYKYTIPLPPHAPRNTATYAPIRNCFPNESGGAKSLRGDFSSLPTQLRWDGSKAMHSHAYGLIYEYSGLCFATTGAGCTPKLALNHQALFNRGAPPPPCSGQALSSPPPARRARWGGGGVPPLTRGGGEEALRRGGEKLSELRQSSGGAQPGRPGSSRSLSEEMRGRLRS